MATDLGPFDPDTGATLRGDAGVRPSPVEVGRAAERLAVTTEWVESGRVRVRRRIVSERRTIEVEVRREVLEIEGDDLDFRDGRLVGTAMTGPAVEQPLPADQTLVLVLREEVPEVHTRVVPYERVTATRVRVGAETNVSATLRHEEISVETPSA